MTDKTVIKINPTKPSKLDFDVTISGLDDIKPKVRFVICDAMKGVDWAVACTHLEDDRWSAALPVLTGVVATSLNFRVEVIADEYFFTPARGQITLMTVKDVEFESKTKKPSVSASFSVSQEDTPTPKKTPKVAESFSAASASSGGETGGGSDPTNALLSPEQDPSIDPSDDMDNPGMYDVKPDEDPGDEEQGDIAYQASITIVQTPGDTELPMPEFDPKTVAAGIIRKSMGSVSRPTTPGRLFKRTADGQAVVDGLESPEAKRALERKAARVKEILGSV